MRKTRVFALLATGLTALFLTMLYLGVADRPSATAGPNAEALSDEPPSGPMPGSPPLASSGERAPSPPGPGGADTRQEPVADEEPAPPDDDHGSPPEPVVTDPHPPPEQDPEPKPVDLVGILEVE